MTWLMLSAGPGAAQVGSLFDPVAAQAPVIAMIAPDGAARGSASLFADSDRAASYFAPWPERERAAHRSAPAPILQGPASGTPVARLRDLIASAEAGPAGYDAVQYGARIRPPKPPTQMRLSEIYAWIAATPGQPHAIGRYQFIPATLKRLVRHQGIGTDQLFSPAMQDRLADQLLREAGIEDFLASRIGRVAFMNKLARIWAGLPNSTGRSHYHGHAGNAATMTWARFEQQMTQIFPASGA
ncbi:hypothetical protein [Roseisalinus antarcticus]|nr:hypothetical protein [Roseisalinus antarcticus]